MSEIFDPAVMDQRRNNRGNGFRCPQQQSTGERKGQREDDDCSQKAEKHEQESPAGEGDILFRQQLITLVVVAGRGSEMKSHLLYSADLLITNAAAADAAAVTWLPTSRE